MDFVEPVTFQGICGDCVVSYRLDWGHEGRLQAILRLITDTFSCEAVLVIGWI